MVPRLDQFESTDMEEGEAFVPDDREFVGDLCTRRRLQPRLALFTPMATKDGPDCTQLSPERRTKIDGQLEAIEGQWNTGTIADYRALFVPWIGKTVTYPTWTR